MRTKIIYIILLSQLWFTANFSYSQRRLIDSLKIEFSKAINDTIKLMEAGNLADAYTEIKFDSALYFAEQELNFARKLRFKLNECYALQQMGYAQMNMGNHPSSLKMLLSAIAIAEDPESENNILPDKYEYAEDLYSPAKTPHLKRLDKLARMHQYVGILYGNAGNHEKEKMHFIEGVELAEKTGNILLLSYCNGTLARAYLSLNMVDSALITIQKAFQAFTKLGYKKYEGSILINFGRIYAALKKPDLATEYYRKALIASREQGYLRGVAAASLVLAETYLHNGSRDSGFYFINQGLDVAKQLNAPSLLLRSYTALSEYYRSSNNNDSVVKYQGLIIEINNSEFNTRQAHLFQSIDFDEQQRHQQKEAAEMARENRLRIYGLLAVLTFLIAVALVLWRNIQYKQKAFSLLKQQKQETDNQRAKVEQALIELRSAQTQLIQSEKMASLGELTAGIAHEIQNPLNFVNNFSEVNKELVQELNQEIEKGNYAEVKSIAKDIVKNEEKINEHGKRADTIVKSMLQHSRTNTGQKELTNINALADEFLRLSYHGMRAKEKTFNATIKTEFDSSIDMININPQDIGRALLNLYNNAFQSMLEKSNLNHSHYEPTISVATEKVDGKVKITVKDNGKGIPYKVLDKIFQPFFTTRSAGGGTGLGLSLSYDIITKEHGGEIRVESKEGDGAEFIVYLPG